MAIWQRYGEKENGGYRTDATPSENVNLSLDAEGKQKASTWKKKTKMNNTKMNNDELELKTFPPAVEMEKTMGA